MAGGKSQQRYHRPRTRFLVLFFASIVFVSGTIFLNENMLRGLTSFVPPLRPSPGGQERPERPERPENPDESDSDNGIAETTKKKPGHRKPYPQILTLPTALLPTVPIDSGEDTKRLIIIGDVHGHRKALEALLRKAKFSAERGDTVIFTGDLVNKGPDSPGVISLAMEIGAYSARGNHDDRVSRAWEYLESQQSQGPRIDSDAHSDTDQGGEERDSEAENAGEEGGGSTGSDSDNENEPAVSKPASQRKKGHKKKHKPRAVDIETAKSLDPAHRDWLSTLPLILRVGNLGPRYGDVVVVHAGLVPGIPLKYQDPKAVMNMRTLLGKNKKHGKKPMIPSPSRDGIPWAEVWDATQSSLHGAHLTTVVYGHDSKAGLQIREHAFGVDSGCARGDALTGLVFEVRPARSRARGAEEGDVGRDSDDDDDDDDEMDEETQDIETTDRGRKDMVRHRLVSVSCADIKKSEK
ncbi:Metallo-dependent phosphatase-like protein [Xylaria intraflava]|nr:Metallo-dependent phosphatase-like protein [Xylaria intraflava]